MKHPLSMLLFCFLILSLFLTPTSACPLVQAVAVKKVVAVQHVVEVPAVVLQPLILTVPSYGVGPAPGYGTGYQTPAPVQAAQVSPCDQKIAVLEQRLNQLLGNGNAANGTPNPARASETGALTRSQRGQQVLLSRCATCHNAPVAEAKGGKHVFFIDGKLANKERDAGVMLEQIDQLRMPKGGKLTDAEFRDILWFLTVTEEEKK